jgi:Protein of unknown function (DUF2937)
VGFMARWLSDAITLVCALGCAVLAMQLPALTRDYTNALLQVSQDARRDIDQREASARQYYHITDTTDAQVVAALKSVEPSNAVTLQESLDRAGVLKAAYDRITETPPLLQPPVAVIDALRDEHRFRFTVLRTTIADYTPQIVLSVAAAVYGVVGLIVGSFLAQALVSILGMAQAPRRV